MAVSAMLRHFMKRRSFLSAAAAALAATRLDAQSIAKAAADPAYKIKNHGIKHTLMAKEMHGMAEKITRANKLPKGIDFLAEEVSYLETIQALIEERAVNLREASALVPELAEL